MRSRLTIGILLLLGSLPLHAQQAVMKFQFGGSDAGENVYEKKADGTFSSVTTLTLMGTKIESTLKGKFAGKRLASFTLQEGAGPQKRLLTYAAGKYTQEAGGQKKSG